MAFKEKKSAAKAQGLGLNIDKNYEGCCLAHSLKTKKTSLEELKAENQDGSDGE